MKIRFAKNYFHENIHYNIGRECDDEWNLMFHKNFKRIFTPQRILYIELYHFHFFFLNTLLETFFSHTKIL